MNAPSPIALAVKGQCPGCGGRDQRLRKVFVQGRGWVKRCKKCAGPTPRQRAILGAIDRLIAEQGRSPTFSEIAEATGLSCKTEAIRLVKELQSFGLVSTRPRKNRSIVLLTGPATNDLTVQQQAVLGFIARYTAELGKSPTTWEIVEGAGLSGKGQAIRLVRDLEECGRLKTTPRKHRSIVLIGGAA